MTEAHMTACVNGTRLKAASLTKLIDLITPVGDETGCMHSLTV
jgi:hypothetical protein